MSELTVPVIGIAERPKIKAYLLAQFRACDERDGFFGPPIGAVITFMKPLQTCGKGYGPAILEPGTARVVDYDQDGGGVWISLKRLNGTGVDVRMGLGDEQMDWREVTEVPATTDASPDHPSDPSSLVA